MLCSNEAGVIDKLCNLGEEFNELYARREYARAMFAYSTASAVAVFLEMDRETMNFFFGNANTDETDEKGLFDRDKVHYASGKCIFGSIPRPYVDAQAMAEILECAVRRTATRK